MKGLAKVKNIRITRLIPIVHDLALHFQTINLDWVPREQNAIADLLARKGAIENVGTRDENLKQPAHFAINFVLNKIMIRN